LAKFYASRAHATSVSQGRSRPLRLRSSARAKTALRLRSPAKSASAARYGLGFVEPGVGLAAEAPLPTNCCTAEAFRLLICEEQTELEGFG
jgi:hypothetical protein